MCHVWKSDGPVSSISNHRDAILQGNLALRFQARDVLGSVQNLDAHDAPVGSVVDGDFFAQPLGGHLDRFIAQADIQGIYFGIMRDFQWFLS
jgi:hypothetical protein